MRPVVHHEVMKELGERFAATMPALTDATVEALDARMPDVAAALDREFVRAAITMTNGRMADHLRGVAPQAEDGAHVALGAVAAQAGIALEALAAAYRLGAALAWDVVVGLAAQLPMPAGAALELAELHVAYVDRLSAESLEGYEQAAERAGAALARERQALLEAVLDGAADLAAASAAARWPLPARVRGAVLLGAGDLPDAALTGRAGGAAVALVPEGVAVGAATPVALGAAVPLREADASLAQARRLAALAAAGHVPAGRLLRWEEHLPALVVLADPAAAAALAARRLAPLEGLAPARRRLLAETLAAWLDHPGQPQAMGRALHLHPQTVRYRIARLREAFGAALDDPAARFELGLALRVRGGAG
jgi:hypothetical protein